MQFFYSLKDGARVEAAPPDVPFAPSEPDVPPPDEVPDEEPPDVPFAPSEPDVPPPWVLLPDSVPPFDRPVDALESSSESSADDCDLDEFDDVPDELLSEDEPRSDESLFLSDSPLTAEPVCFPLQYPGRLSLSQ